MPTDYGPLNQDMRDFIDAYRAFGSLAPQGIPWQSWRPSQNVEDMRGVGLMSPRVPPNATPVPRQASPALIPNSEWGGILSSGLGYRGIDKAAQYDALQNALQTMGQQ